MTKNTNPKQRNNFKRSMIICLFILMLTPLFADTEFHALQVLATDWAYASGNNEKEAALRNIIREAPQKGFNAIIFQAQDAGELFYPSETGTWSTMFLESDPGFDPLSTALQEARANKLLFYVHIDVLTAYSMINKPKSPEHLFLKYGKKWILADDSGLPLESDAYYYLDPSNPEVISFLKKQVNEITVNYYVDGFYFSHIKYPDDRVLKTREFSESYESVRFFTKNNIESYARDIITSCLEALVCEIKLMKPYLTVFAESEALLTETKGIRNYYPADNHYFQDPLAWLEGGAVDVLVPRIHARSKAFENFIDIYLNAAGEYAAYIIPSIRGDEENYRDADIKRSLEFLKKNEGRGAVIHSAEDALKRSPFEQTADLPYLSRGHMGYRFIEIDLTRKIIPKNIVHITPSKRFAFPDSERKLSFVLGSLPGNLFLESMEERMRFPTRTWTVPYRYKLLPDNSLERHDMFIELRRAPSFMTTDSSYHFLFRAGQGETRINDKIIQAYSNTGIFFDEIPLRPYGRQTRIRGSVTEKGKTLFYEDIYYGNMPDTTTKHAVILKSVSPQGSVILPPDDVLRITFESHLAEEMDTILLYVNGKPYPLFYNGSRYVANVPCRPYANVDSAYIQVAARDKNSKEYSYNMPLSLKVRPADHFPLIESTEDFTPVSYSLGVVRLGGPYINEFPPGVRFVTDGIYGDNYRIRLNKTEAGYVHKRYVKTLPAGMPAPQYHISSMSVRPDSSGDILTIPWPEPVPYAITPQPEQKRIRIRLYGAQSISTWITHREGLSMIDYVTWEQKDAETYDIYVNLNTDNIWGYELTQHARFLSFRLKYPPQRKNLLIAIEAGHGGEWNLGAVGLSGLFEKDINRDTAEKIRDMLIEIGYDVVEVRPGDSSPNLRERWLMTDSLQADVFVSIHANAAGGHYLRVGGTSTYYNNPFWRDFAEMTYGKLRELPLEEFGMVGSFNYMMCRMPQRPSILVELAFMSHAEDENKMADPAFRTKMAQKITEAINEYINQKLK